jgi:hypothetical protein
VTKSSKKANADYKPKMCMTRPKMCTGATPNCVWASFISMEKRQYKEKKSKEQKYKDP